MERLDNAENPNIGVLVDILRDISSKTEPLEIMAAFGPGYASIRPYDLMMSVSKRGLEPGAYKITRVFTPESVPDSPDAEDYPNPWRDWAKIPEQHGGFIGDVLDFALPQVIHALDVDNDPVLGDLLAEMGSCEIMPAWDTGEPLNWLLRFRKDPDGYTLKELEEDLLVTNLFGGATRNMIALKQVKELHDALRDQFEQIAKIQQSLLPKRLPKIGNIEISTSYLTSDQAGGDYYDFFQFPSGQLGVVIADVSGHGPAAATVMAMFRAILHCYESNDYSPDSVMNFVNERIVKTELDGSFITAFYVVLETDTGTMTFSRCGHNPPRVRKLDGVIATLDDDGTVPLGLFSPLEARSAAAKLDPGDTMVLYTDGITEAFNGNREMFGVERLDEAIRKSDGSPDSIVESIHASLYAFTLSRTRDDDQTIVAFRYGGD
jgi:sigma-B regulation protein RsbU (phosphoserine phosphatase)